MVAARRGRAPVQPDSSSTLARVAVLAMQLQSAGPPRPRTMRRAVALEDELRAEAAERGRAAACAAPTKPRREPPPPCRCPDADPTITLGEWVAEGCPAHHGEPGRSVEADRRIARGLLAARLRAARDA